MLHPQIQVAQIKSNLAQIESLLCETYNLVSSLKQQLQQQVSSSFSPSNSLSSSRTPKPEPPQVVQVQVQQTELPSILNNKKRNKKELLRQSRQRGYHWYLTELVPNNPKTKNKKK